MDSWCLSGNLWADGTSIEYNLNTQCSSHSHVPYSSFIQRSSLTKFEHERKHEVSSFMPKQPKPTVIPYNCLPQNHRSIGQSKEVLLATANRLKKPGSSIRSSAVMLSFPSGALFTITSCIRHDPTWFDMIRHDLTWSDTGKSSASLCKAQHLQIIMNHCESLWVIKIPYDSIRFYPL